MGAICERKQTRDKKYMNTSFQKIANKTTDEWYTPQWILERLGEFDLDPCSPEKRLWDTAKVHVDAKTDGLSLDWSGKRVWLNPPYSNPKPFVEKLVKCNNGILLTFNRLDTRMFQDIVLPNASGILFMRGRVKFYRPDGQEGGTSGCGSVLVSFGEENAEVLKTSNIQGYFVKL